MQMITRTVFLILLSLRLYGDATQDLITEAFHAYEKETLTQKPHLIEKLEKLALQHNLDAAFLLATAYKNGRLKEDKEHNALKWYLIAAQEGDHDAQLMLGWLYYQGTPYLQKDIKKAKEWFQKASDGGVIEATQMLNML